MTLSVSALNCALRIPHDVGHWLLVSALGIQQPRVLSDFKAYATRALRRAFSDMRRRRYWAHHGSTRYLWNEVCLKAAIEYVLNGQGERMAHYPEARTRSLTLPAQFQR